MKTFVAVRNVIKISEEIKLINILIHVKEVKPVCQIYIFVIFSQSKECIIDSTKYVYVRNYWIFILYYINGKHVQADVIFVTAENVPKIPRT